MARALNGARVVDPCAGKGDVALPLAHYLEREVLLCDVSERALDTASERAREAGLDTISTRLVDCAELGPHLNEDDCVVALRACGAVTDMAIAAAENFGSKSYLTGCLLNEGQDFPSSSLSPVSQLCRKKYTELQRFDVFHESLHRPQYLCPE